MSNSEYQEIINIIVTNNSGNRITISFVDSIKKLTNKTKHAFILKVNNIILPNESIDEIELLEAFILLKINSSYLIGKDDIISISADCSEIYINGNMGGVVTIVFTLNIANTSSHSFPINIYFTGSTTPR